jgi:hypothetical protein
MIYYAINTACLKQHVIIFDGILKIYSSVGKHCIRPVINVTAMI